jgi:hypothetical protein
MSFPENTHASLEAREIAMAPPLATFEDSPLIELALAGNDVATMLKVSHRQPLVRERYLAW